MLCVHNLVVCYSSNAFFRTISDNVARIVSLLFIWQDSGGAIANGGGKSSSLIITGSEFIANTANKSGGAISQVNGTAVITGSNFEGNTASNDSNNIWNKPGDDFTCNDGNEFKNPVGSTYEVGLCD
jgi:predicted outer membrane repeat protein